MAHSTREAPELSMQFSMDWLVGGEGGVSEVLGPGGDLVERRGLDCWIGVTYF